VDAGLAALITHPRLDELLRRFDAGATLFAIDQVIEADVLDAITSRLTTQTGTSRGVASNLYPLAVQNVLARGMNAAAALGAPKVTAAMVREGGR
jgi:type II secretory pathway predicted ATPase ExeA